MLTSPHLFIGTSIAIFSFFAYFQARSMYNSAPSAFRSFTRTLLGAYLLLWVQYMIDAVVLPAGGLTRLPLTSLYLLAALLIGAAFVVLRLAVGGVSFMFLVRRQSGGEAPQGPLPTDEKRRSVISRGH